MDRLERLRQLRAAAMLNAERLPDDQAVKVPTMYEAWAPDTAYQVDTAEATGTTCISACRRTHPRLGGSRPTCPPCGLR